MCDICRKYRCPDGCPNNFHPKKRVRSKETAERGLRFTVRTVLHADGEIFRKIIINDKISMKSEIREGSEGIYDKGFGK